MARKSITTSRTVVACDVCGRTLLRGEHADAFIAGGSRRMVCELCTARAANEGWIREGADNATTVRHNGARGGRSLLGRLRPRREGARPLGAAGAAAGHGRLRVDPIRRAGEPFDPQIAPEPLDVPDELAGGEPARGDRAPSEPAAEIPEQPAAPPVPNGPMREPRHVRAVPTNADLKMGRALDVFNASAHPRRIAGVARSLGAPMATVSPSATEGAIVTIVVGWELCWYRYEVDLADEAAGVRVIGQGDELSELAEQERWPNAAADERGLLGLAG